VGVSEKCRHSFIEYMSLVNMFRSRFLFHKNTKIEHLCFIVVFIFIIIQFFCVTLNTQRARFFAIY